MSKDVYEKTYFYYVSIIYSHIYISIDAETHLFTSMKRDVYKRRAI